MINPTWLKDFKPTFDIRRESWSKEDFVNFVRTQLMNHPGFPPLPMFFGEPFNRAFTLEMKLQPLVLINVENAKRPIFWQTTSVTFQLYMYYCMATGYPTPENIDWPDPDKIPLYPQTNVSAIDACRFLNWLSEQFGFAPVYQVTDTDIVPLHKGPGFQLPQRTAQDAVIQVLKDLELGNLGQFVVHRENSNNQLQIAGAAKPWVNDLMIGVLFPEDYTIHLNAVLDEEGNVITPEEDLLIAKKGDFWDKIYTYEDFNIDVSRLSVRMPNATQKDGTIGYPIEATDPIIGILDPTGNTYTMTTEYTEQIKSYDK